MIIGLGIISCSNVFFIRGEGRCVPVYDGNFTVVFVRGDEMDLHPNCICKKIQIVIFFRVLIMADMTFDDPTMIYF